MPRFDRGVVNTKLEKGDIVLMGNPTQYGEILAENILVEDILKADLETLISGSNLVRGKFYRITNAVSSTLSLLVQGLTANTICDYAYNTANGDLVTYNISTDLAGVPFSSVYVPYTGATADVNLGEYQIKVGQLELDQTPTGTFGVGKIRWNDTDGTPEVMLKGANVTLQIGQEQLARVVNKTNTNLTEAGYQVVRISGAQGQRLKVGLAQANSTSTCKDTLGLVTENISNNAEGFITTSGLVRSINTTGSLQGETWADGDRLYLSPSVAGGITNVEPSAPNIVIVLGYVVYAHANQGSIYVSVEGAKALHELFDVSIPTPTNNNVLVYESSTGLWKDKSISTILGFTPIANNATVGGELSGTLPNPSLVTSAVTGKALTGLSVSGSAVVSTDSILTGIGKLQNQINAVLGSVNFQGVWNASTNSPSLASGVGTKGYYYVVSVAGSTNLDGITDWKLGDWAIYNGTAWQKVDNTDAVVSVNGYTGIVTLAKADIGLGNVENTALSTWAGSGNITTLGTIGTGVWNGTAIGDTYISSASTWNAKIGGSGTTGKLPKFTGTSALGDSIIQDNGSTATIGGALTANGTLTVNEDGASTKIITIRSNWAGVDPAINVTTNNSLLLMTNNTERMRITSTGNVGIGTTSPETNLQIVGDTFSIIRATSSSGVQGIDFGFVGDSDAGRVRYNPTTHTMSLFADNAERVSLSATELITFGASDTGEAHIFGGSARVNGALGVKSDVNSTLYTTIDNQDAGSSAWSGIKLMTFGNNWEIRTGSTANNGNALDFWNYGNQLRMRITDGGNVGIGTANPAALLDVNGNTHIRNTIFVDTITSYSGGKLVVQSGFGNVLIGTTTDDGVNKLQVSGSAKIITSDARLLGGDSVGRFIISNASTETYVAMYGASHATVPNTMALVVNNISALNLANTGAATFSSSVQATANASGRSAFFGGASYGIRIDNSGSFNNGGSVIHGVDNTFVASYQKLSLNGSSLELMTDYITRIVVGSAGNTIITASDRVLELRGAGGGANSLLRFSDATTAKFSTGFNGGNYIIYDDVNAAYRLQINGTTGAATFSSSVTAASGIFNGAVQINSSVAGLILNRPTTSQYNGVSLLTGGVSQWFVGLRENLTSNDYIIYNESGYDAFALNKATGAATFSSSVTANGGNIKSISAVGNAFVDIDGAVAGTLSAIRFFSDSSTKWIQAVNTDSPYRYGIGKATSGTTYDEYFGLDYSTGAATFSSSVQATTLKLTSLPTSSAGLSAGDIWNDGGTLKIV